MENAQSSTAPGALAGIKVIDLTRVLAGPYCTQMLADHGAEVIKIEPPHGDEARAWGPPFRESDGSASYWVNVNRNKRAMALDLSKPEGREILLRLLATADVLIDNFKTGTMAKWGLDYEQVLRERFPRLIYCRISGFGADGPLGGLPGYDGAVQALAGLMSINGTPTSGPVRVGMPIVDMAVGMMSTIGILMALHERSKSGKGQMLDATLFDTALAILHPHMANFLESGKPPVRTGNVHPNVGPYDLFQTKTRPIYIACGNDRQFAALCAELGRDDLAANPLYRTNGDRVRNSAPLKVDLEAALANLDGVEFAAKLLEKGIPCGPVLEVPDLVTHAHTAHRNMIVGNPEAQGDGYRAVANPVKLSRTPASVRSSPPQFGESTQEVLAELGYSAAEIDTLVAAGVALASLPVNGKKK